CARACPASRSRATPRRPRCSSASPCCWRSAPSASPSSRPSTSAPEPGHRTSWTASATGSCSSPSWRSRWCWSWHWCCSASPAPTPAPPRPRSPSAERRTPTAPGRPPRRTPTAPGRPPRRTPTAPDSPPHRTPTAPDTRATETRSTMQTAPPTTAPTAPAFTGPTPVDPAPRTAPAPSAADGRDPVIVLKDLSFRYPGTDRDTLRNVDLTIERGDFVAVVGGNGSAKTTLCKTFNGLVPHYWNGDFAGSVHVQGVDTW